MYDVRELRDRSATTWYATARRWRPIARRARRSRRSRVESAMDELARKLGMDPIALREKNAARDGVKAAYGVTHREHRLSWRRWRRRSAIRTTARRSGPNQGRGVASGFWFNIGGESSAAVHVDEDGTVVAVSRQSRHRRLARLDGDDGRRGAGPARRKRAADRRRHRLDRLTMLTGGSRVTFATGMAATGGRESGRAAQAPRGA